jgi:hypothetical protein
MWGFLNERVTASLILRGKKSVLGAQMQRSEALSYLKEILNADSNISPDVITLEKPTLSNGYRVHIKELYHPETVKNIAQKHQFALKEEKGEIVVYKPQPSNLNSAP